MQGDEYRDISVWWTPLVLVGYVLLFVGMIAASLATAIVVGFAGLYVYRWVENPGLTMGFWLVMAGWLAVSAAAYAYERYRDS